MPERSLIFKTAINYIILSLIISYLYSSVFGFLEIKRDYKQDVVKNFPVYWNVPTKACKKYNIDFESLLTSFGIITNKGDEFRGDDIIIVYDPGHFPIVKKLRNGTEIIENGGIPQEGNLDEHLEKVRKDIDKFVKNENFSGIGIIDFETWRPVFRQNWNAQVVYRNMTFERILKKNNTYSKNQLIAAAKEDFESDAKKFMLSTIEEFVKLRPFGKWGYYGFPYCYNFRGAVMNATCPDMAVRENNETVWLFNASKAFYPSLYLSNKFSLIEHVDFMIGVLNEAYRVSAMVGFREIIPYLWFKYNEETHYLSAADMFYSFEVPRVYKVGGAIIWGKTQDTNNKNKCEVLYQYVNDTLGPALQQSRGNEHSIQKALAGPFIFTYRFLTNWWKNAYNKLFG